MDAVHILRRGLRVLHLVLLRQALVAVAIGAGAGQVQFENWRIDVFRRLDVVRSMAIPTTGGAGSAQRMADPMDAGRVSPGCLLVFGLVFMAGNTGGRRQFAVMNEFLDSVMAIDA